jgi:hypothetical protein
MAARLDEDSRRQGINRLQGMIDELQRQLDELRASNQSNVQLREARRAVAGLGREATLQVQDGATLQVQDGTRDEDAQYSESASACQSSANTRPYSIINDCTEFTRQRIFIPEETFPRIPASFQHGDLDYQICGSQARVVVSDYGTGGIVESVREYTNSTRLWNHLGKPVRADCFDHGLGLTRTEVCCKIGPEQPIRGLWPENVSSSTQLRVFWV